jgi:hypothetical protein
LFSAGGDSTAKQWDKATGEVVRTFTFDAGAVLALAAKDDILFCGSTDQTSFLVQFTISTGVLSRKLEGLMLTC